LFNGYTVSFAKWKESGNGWRDGCMTMWMYLIALKCTLKMIKMVNFMLDVLRCNLQGLKKTPNFAFFIS
jgi:hypothetical protein